MKQFYSLFFLLLTSHILNAQTWDGSESTDWNLPANWNTNAVPLATGNVTIPNTANKPALSSNVTVASITATTAGSNINFNGYTLTVNGSLDIERITLNNTNIATDIVITINGSATSYFGGNIINDHIIINYNSSSTMYDGYLASNTHNGNVTYNIGGSGQVFTSYSQPSVYNGNFTLIRTVAGSTELFNSGLAGISGNFSYTNNAGGNNNINSGGNSSGAINGTININTAGIGNPKFQMRKIKNLTDGGSISVQNSGEISILDDTLKVTTLNVSGFTTGSSDQIQRCVIQGNLTFSEATTNTGSVYFGENTITGTTILSTGAVANLTWYEGYLSGNTYIGNTSFLLNGIGRFYSSYSAKSTFNGNLTVNRTTAGITDLFNAGFTGITGNFSYINNAGGDNFINSGGNISGAINGTLNITTAGNDNPRFLMRKIKNLAAGGNISVQNSGEVYIIDDTLKVTAFNVSGFTTSSGDQIQRCVIHGNLTFSEATTNTGPVYFGENTITGTTILSTNAVANLSWYEGYLSGNTYIGNTSFLLNGIGRFYSSFSAKSTFNGNLTVNRTTAGITDLFNAGFTGITGNFSYINNAGGDNLINGGGNIAGEINGTINITIAGTGNPRFVMRKIKNLTGGGNISVQNSGEVYVIQDTLLVTVVNISGFTTSSSDQIQSCLIQGNLTFVEAEGNTGPVYFGQNIISGNLILTSFNTTWYESYLGSNIFNGDVTINKNNASGTFNFGYSDTTYVNKNFTLNSASNINFNSAIVFGGSASGTVEQLGTQPILIPGIQINKTDEASITLNDSLTVTNTATFSNGLIYTSIGKELIFPNNIGSTGASVGSHVVGPVIKTGDDIFEFPVGSPNTLNTIAMSAPAGVASRFRASYIIQNPSIDGLNTNNKAGSISNVSNAGYWQVERLTGATNVNLTLGFGTNPYYQFPALANLKVAQWNGSQWDDKGNGGTTGTAVNGTITHTAGNVNSYTFFALANQLIFTYFYVTSNPGTGPDGTPVKIKGTGGFPTYQTKQLPAGTYSNDSIYLLPNGGSSGFKLRDILGVEKYDTTITLPALPTTLYVAANATGTVNFSGWRHFVYMRTATDSIIGAIRDNDLTLGNTTMQALFAAGNTGLSPNGNVFLKRSFDLSSALSPLGTKRIRFYISKTEFTNLQAANPAAFPNGINSLHVYHLSGGQTSAIYNPIPGSSTNIYQPADLTIADAGTMYSVDVNVPSFSGFYFGGIQQNLPICGSSSITIPSNVSGSTYRWQIDNGSGFNSLNNNAIYSGVTTASLTLTNAPTSLNGIKLRCRINNTNTFSQVYTIQFNNKWMGTANNIWENPANWSCGVLPDANTDVIIMAGRPNYPQIGVNSSVRSMKVESGTSVTVKPGFTLTVTK